MDRQQYLHRIGYSGEASPEKASPTLETLRELQKSHFLHVPFENLDIHHGNPIELDLDKIFEKVVNQHRGGFCYELNGLFHELLKTFGFQVTRISARVYDSVTPNPSISEGGKGFGPEFDHLVNVVRIGESDYLTDVGFGGFAFYPLKIELDTVQEDTSGNYRIEQHDDTYLQVSKETDGVWGPKYLFTQQERQYSDYASMCHYHQTSPDSHFTKNRMCTLPTEDGRVTLSGDVITITGDKGKEEITIKDDREYRDYLWEFFRIKID